MCHTNRRCEAERQGAWTSCYVHIAKCFSVHQSFETPLIMRVSVSLQVIMDKFYLPASANEGGTLFQLRNVLNRRNVVSKVSKNYHATGAFIDLVLEAHIIVAIMQHLEMDDVNQTPSMFPRRLHLVDRAGRKRFLKNLIGTVIDSFIFGPMVQSLQRVADPEANAGEDCHDRVLNYAANFMKFGLIRAVTVLTTASGDGNRAMWNWKYSLIIYQQGHKTKYRLEAFLLQAAVKALLPPRLAEQVKWSRFVNYSGGEGKNLDGDYVMERLNKLAKSKVRKLGPNHTSEMVMRIGKTLQFCYDVMKHFEVQIQVAPIGRTHKDRDLVRDRNLLIEELHNRVKVFEQHPGREHTYFAHQPVDIFADCDVADLHQWLSSKRVEFARVMGILAWFVIGVTFLNSCLSYFNLGYANRDIWDGHGKGTRCHAL